MIGLTRYVDPRRSQAPVDHPTDEEILDLADEEANRADHDNQCQKDLEVE